ncbi:MAG: hypothetical protein KF775_00165 [Cyclobacteriaceae bacterium]|nr:hypothetical protein [Cyclobacteriaceae bacterium]
MKVRILILLLIAGGKLMGQPNVIQKAMRDEIDRSMRELKLDTLQPPCYVSCSISDVTYYNISATLGGILNSSEQKARAKGNRVLVGTYEMNDESLDNNLFSAPEANDIAVPLDDDYLGIRRALWVSIDNVYRSASRQHAKNVETWREQKKPLEEIPHRVFAKVPAIKLAVPLPAVTFDKKKWETYLKQLTQRFVTTDYPGSSLSLRFEQGIEYFESSEGTSLKLPVQKTALQLTIVGRTPEGELVFDQHTWEVRQPDDLPTMAELDAEITRRLARIEAQTKAKKLEDDYTGPVLIEGSSVADVLASILFAGRERLVYDNNIPNPASLRADARATLENRLGKNILDPAITVKALARTHTYKGVPLLGAFEADSEGTVPPAELVLVEKGILKDMLNDRSLTSTAQTANGHRDGPGVIQVVVSEQATPRQLKEKLIAQAKAAGLEYALIVRNEELARYGILNVYKVDVNTGAETYERNARFNQFSFRTLRKVVATAEDAAYNLSGNGNSTSYIVPQQLLLGELEILRAEMPAFKEEEFVKNPLKHNP